MLTQLKIHNYILIDQLTLDFKSGLTVLTGETGSGKSIIIDGLMLIFGKKISKNIIQENKETASFEASFELSNNVVTTWLKEHDLINLDEPQHLICRRIVDIVGKNKFYINGFSVTKTQIEELGELILDIHTQHASITLIKPETQRSLLDEYAALTAQIEQIKNFYSQIKQLEQKLSSGSKQNELNQEKLQDLQNKIEELHSLNLKPNEWEELELQHKQMSHAALILSELDHGINLIHNEENSIISGLNQLKAKLDKLQNLDPEIGKLTELCDSISIEVDELSYGLNQIAKNVSDDPNLLKQLEERIDAIFTLSRKFRKTPVELPDYLNQLFSESALLKQDLNLQKLNQELVELKTNYNNLAKVISNARIKSAKELNLKINQLLAQLSIKGEFKIEVTPNDQLSSFGMDNIEYKISFNPGLKLQSLAYTVSGGELSRVALAIYLVLSAKSTPEVLIFDEIDVGIGGKIAATIGKMLNQLSKTTQIICITHQPQTASFGDHHLIVNKEQHKNQTKVSVAWVEKEQRVNEIARMLSGINLTETTISHAKEMLSQSSNYN